MGRASYLRIPVWVIACATTVVLLVLAKGLMISVKGSRNLGQFDIQWVKYVFMVLQLHVLQLRVPWSPQTCVSSRWQGRRKRILRDNLYIYGNQFRYWVFTSKIIGFQFLLVLLTSFIGNLSSAAPLGKVAVIEDPQYLTLVKYEDIVIKDSYQKFVKILSNPPEEITNPCAPQKIKKPDLNSSAKVLFFFHKISMDSVNKSCESGSEVAKITEKLEDTIIDCSGIIIHSNNDSSDAEEEINDCELIGFFVSEGRMKYKVVEKSLKYAWDFLTTYEDVRVYEIEQNYMIFNFGSNSELKEYVFDTRPWSIDGTLVILHPYNPAISYTELDWSHQAFWIEIRDLLPEHMNQKTVKEMGKLMGEVIDIEPKAGLPKSGDYFRVCVNINISTPLRRGLLCLTAAKTTKWIGFFYEKQPSKICKECYILKHSKEECKKAAASLAVIHSQVHYFSSMRGAKKNTMPSSVKISPIMKGHPKKVTSANRFVPPKDGLVLQTLPGKETMETQGNTKGDSGVVLGKRLRREDHGISPTGPHVTVSGFSGSLNPVSPSTGKGLPAGSSQLPTYEKTGEDKGVAGVSGGRINMES